MTASRPPPPARLAYNSQPPPPVPGAESQPFGALTLLCVGRGKKGGNPPSKLSNKVLLLQNFWGTRFNSISSSSSSSSSSCCCCCVVVSPASVYIRTHEGSVSLISPTAYFGFPFVEWRNPAPMHTTARRGDVTVSPTSLRHVFWAT